MVSNGSKWVAYYSEFADSDPYRRGIAISRFAAAMINACAIIKDEVMTKTTKGLPTIQTWATILNFGLATPKTVQKLSAPAASNTQARYSELQMTDAVKSMSDWLHNDTSPMRSFLAIVANGGNAYVTFLIREDGPVGGLYFGRQPRRHYVSDSSYGALFQHSQ